MVLDLGGGYKAQGGWMVVEWSGGCEGEKGGSPNRADGRPDSGVGCGAANKNTRTWLEIWSLLPEADLRAIQ